MNIRPPAKRDSVLQRAHVQRLEHEHQHIGDLLDLLGRRLAGTVAGLAVDAQQQRIALVLAGADGLV